MMKLPRGCFLFGVIFASLSWFEFRWRGSLQVLRRTSSEITDL